MPEPTGSAQSGNRTVMLILAYLGPLALVPLLVEKNDAEVQWHAKHGLVLMVAYVIIWIALTIVGSVIGSLPGLGCLTAIVGTLLYFVLGILGAVVAIIGIMKALKGERLLIPGISEYANRF